MPLQAISSLLTHSLAFVFLSLLFWGSVNTLLGRQTDESPLTVAQRYIAGRQFHQALGVLEQHLRRYPNDFEALRLSARTSYWVGDTQTAQTRYEKAVSVSEHDTPTRLEYAQFLIETGSYRRAEQILTPVIHDPASRPEAEALLGRASYWQGDWAAAVRYFESVLKLRPDHEDTRRQLWEIRSATAPQSSLATEYQSDNQPIRRYGATAEILWHATPLTPVILKAGLARATVQDTGRQTGQADVSVRHSLPRPGVTFEVGGGFVRIADPKRTEVKYNMGVSLRLPQSFHLHVRAGREPYLETSASFVSAVSTRFWSLSASRLESQSWTGQVEYRNIEYPDANTGSSLSAWVLLPLNNSPQLMVRGGYGFAFQNTDLDRFVLLAQDLTGTYVPYYTPLSVQAHSALLSLEAPLHDRLLLRVNGSYGFLASERAPSYRSTAGFPGPPGSSSIVKQFRDRSFTPWQVCASVKVNISAASTVQLNLSKLETAYYQVNVVTLGITHRFLPVRD